MRAGRRSSFDRPLSSRAGLDHDEGTACRARFPRRSVMSRRLTVGVLLFGAAALALLSLQQPERVAAQQKGNATAVQQKILQLEQANATLQQQNAQLQQQIKQLQSA